MQTVQSTLLILSMVLVVASTSWFGYILPILVLRTLWEMLPQFSRKQKMRTRNITDLANGGGGLLQRSSRRACSTSRCIKEILTQHGASENAGPLFWGPCKQDSNMLVGISWGPYLWRILCLLLPATRTPHR